MIKTKLFITAFALSLLFGSFSADARCTGCTTVGVVVDFDDPRTTYSAIVTYITWYTNAQGQHVHQVNYLTLTGTTMAYCQQQLNAVMASPGTSVVQFCQID